MLIFYSTLWSASTTVVDKKLNFYTICVELLSRPAHMSRRD